MSHRMTFTDRRRAMLARRVESLEMLEGRAMITESLGILTLGVGVPTATASFGADVAAQPIRVPSMSHSSPNSGILFPTYNEYLPQDRGANVGPGGKVDRVAITPLPVLKRAGDWLILSKVEDVPRSNGVAITAAPPLTQGRSNAGGSSPRGGGSAGPGAGVITPVTIPAPTTSAAAAMILPASDGNAQGTLPATTSQPRAVPTPSASGSTSSSPAGLALTTEPTSSGRSSSGAGKVDPGLIHVSGVGAGASLASFPYFPLYTLDYNDGTVLYPGTAQFGTAGGTVDLIAQASNTTGVSFAWSYSGSQINGSSVVVTGTDYDQLQFQWSAPTGAGPYVDFVTVQATNGSSQVETQTYTFVLESGVSGSNGTTSWPQAVSPDLTLAGTTSVASRGVSVATVSGALDAMIPLPTYNANIPALALTYDSTTANPQPIVVEHHALTDTLAVPSEVSAQLTFNGTAGTTYYYNTSQFTPGDIEQIGLQANASAVSTGRYAYTVTLGDIRGSTTTTTATGTATVLNYAGSAFGAGWTLSGLEQVTPASGGVILDLGSGGQSLWFSGTPGSGGGTYTDPGGEFSTMVLNSNGTYTRTLTNGTKYNFNSSGQETSSLDRNGLTVTYAYSSGRLTTITDPYAKVTTFTYNGSNELQTITDPTGRVATFTHTGSNLTGVTLPDSSTWAYGYDGSGRLTQATDPDSHTVTVAYDSASRASTITRPDGAIQAFSADQEQGWTNSGTSGSPATATLLAVAAGTYTDPLGNVTEIQPDWRGQGLADDYIDALGNVSTADRDANGLATVTIDPLSRVTLESYDAYGNAVTITYPALNTDHYSYNSFAEPTTHTDGDGHTTSYSYDIHGNLTVIEDPLLNLTTMTYTANGKLATNKDADNHTTSYAYDSQDRLTTISNPDGSTNLTSYGTAGTVTSTTDGRGDVTTYSYDPMSRTTGMTDALGNPTTYVYDAAGNQTAVNAPLSRTTSYAYDSMNRQTTVTDPLGHATVTAYDSGGNVKTVTDPLGRITTYSYDADNRRTVVKDPLGNLTTTVYDPAGQTTQVKDPLSETASFTYNSNGWQTTAVDSLGHVSTYTYSGTGKLLTISNPANSGGYLQQNTYDADDRPITSTDGDSNTTTTVYDGVGNVIAVTDPKVHTTSYAYDTMNRRTTVTDPFGHTTVTGYDSGGDAKTVTDALGHTTTTLYDALNRATTVTNSVLDMSVYIYDIAGRQTVVVDPNGNRTTFAFDAADRLTTQTNPNGATSTFIYDADNELTDTTDFDGRRVTYSYDSGGRKTGEKWVGASPAETVTYTYDSVGDLTGVIDANATLTFTYDSGGNALTQATSSPGGQPNVTLTAAYDQNNNETSLTDNLSSPATTTYVYDAAQRLVSITNSFGTIGVGYGYDSVGNVTSVSRIQSGGVSPLTTSYSYDAANRLTTESYQWTSYSSGGGSGGSVTHPLATYTYGYDNANRLTSQTNAEGAVTYSYDNSNQLTNTSGSRAETYTYDSGGNRTTSGYSTAFENETTASTGYTYTYDNEGNLVGETNTSSHVVTTYTYDDRNRLTLVTVGGTVEATYTYDALNRRIGANDNGTQTWTVYNAQNPYADFARGGSGGTVLTERYLYGPGANAILARTSSGGSTAWYLTDNAGSVRDIASIGISSVTVLDHIVYDSFGNVTSESSPSSGDRFKFQSMQYDTTVGLYYDNARWYNPVIGKFVSLDPIGFAAGDVNLYRFVDNEPTDATDPSGRSSFAISAAVSGGIYTANVQAIRLLAGAAITAGGEALGGAISAGIALAPPVAIGVAIAAEAAALAYITREAYLAATEYAAAATLSASLDAQLANVKKVAAIKQYQQQLILANTILGQTLTGARIKIASAIHDYITLQEMFGKEPTPEQIQQLAAALAAIKVATDAYERIRQALGN